MLELEEIFKNESNFPILQIKKLKNRPSDLPKSKLVSRKVNTRNRLLVLWSYVFYIDINLGWEALFPLQSILSITQFLKSNQVYSSLFSDLISLNIKI